MHVGASHKLLLSKTIACPLEQDVRGTVVKEICECQGKTNVPQKIDKSLASTPGNEALRVNGKGR